MTSLSRATWLLTRVLALPLAVMPQGCSKRDERIDMTEYVLIYPGAPIVEIPGESKEITVQVRNVSEVKLTRLTLEVKSPACSAAISPGSIPELIPGARKPFSVKLVRDKHKARQRYPLQLTLYGDGLPVPAGLDMMVDTGPPLDKGWINVGQVTLIHQEQSKTVYYVLAGTPLLILVCWLLWRWSRPGRQRAHDIESEADADGGDRVDEGEEDGSG
jgi:hypothetical protein